MKIQYVESHHSLGYLEGYQAFIRQVVLKIHYEHHSVPKEATLIPAMKALNDTMVPLGLYRYLFYLGVVH